MSLLHQQVDVVEVLGYEQLGVAHEVQYVPEHPAVAVYEVMLLQRVQHDRYDSVEQLGQPRVGIPATGRTGRIFLLYRRVSNFIRSSATCDGNIRLLWLPEN